eukprot:TRINITY_DN41841_c0_g1_i1.p1 TRINITY_DN41841_c0_g1~~TRINITY_DN41841_c0_g1_i1.p1  ORF type:complete len:417 (-),score=78.04 TRINITY_DN41841_c0_g1_i1:94-1344(-)
MQLSSKDFAREVLIVLVLFIAGVAGSSECPYGNISYYVLRPHGHNCAAQSPSECVRGEKLGEIVELLVRPNGPLAKLVLDEEHITEEELTLLLPALKASQTLRVVTMNACHLGTTGALQVLAMLQNMVPGRHELLELQNNGIDYDTCQALLQAADKIGIVLNLDGNPSEAASCITHAVGVFLSCVGWVGMQQKCKGKPFLFRFAMTMYCASLLIMFLMSLLHHSAAGWGCELRDLFLRLDICSIFGTIMGSYLPPLLITLRERRWMPYMLGIVLFMGSLGIAMNFVEERWGIEFRNAVNLTMGWMSIVMYFGMAEELGRGAIGWMMAGSLLGTVGIHFLMRHRWTFGLSDHAVWHIFIILTCSSFYASYYFYVAEGPHSRAAGKTLSAARFVDEHNTLEDSEDELGDCAGRERFDS